MRVTVGWGYELHSIPLSDEQWLRIMQGQPLTLTLTGDGYTYDGENFEDAWAFEGGLHGELEVRYGNDSAVGWCDALRSARIDPAP